MTKAIHILYLEDEANLEEVVKLYLEKEGIDAEIVRVETLSDFKSELSNNNFDLIFVDRLLDDFDGFDAITITRNHYSTVPIIVISGELDEATIVRALKLGANDYILKQNITRIGPVISKILSIKNDAEDHLANTLEALRKSESNLRAILDNMVETFYRTDLDGRLVMISPSVYSLLGYKPDELLGKRLSEFYLEPEGRENFLKELEINNGIVQNYEAPLKHKTGEAIWVSTCSRYYRDENGEIAGVEGTTRNINKRHYAEEALRKNNEELEKRVELRTNELSTYKTRYEVSQTYANIGTWDWNIQTNELYWSDRIAPLFGYPDGELETTYENFLAAVHPDDREKVVNAVNACVETGAEYNIEHRCVWPDGTVRWLLEKGDVSRDKDGNPIHMLGVVQDITLQKRAEFDLKENQEKLSALFKLSPLGIVLTDINGKFIEFNDSFKEICGYPDEELKSLDYWQLTPKEYETQEQEQLALLYSTGKYGPYEKSYRQKNGTLIPIRLNGVLIEDAKNEKHIWSIVEDITDQKHSEEQLIQAKNNAIKANKAKSEFLSHMSHELRTPLNAIIGFSQLLQYDENLKADQLDSVNEIHNAGSHLLDLINEILDLSRIESGKIDIEQQALNLSELINHCINLTGNIAKSKTVSINNEITNHFRDVNVYVDPKRLKQSILNLLSNAIKYNRNDGQVTISYSNPDSEHIQIDITDTGLGISETNLKNLFVPFNRLGAENSKIEGTGIGLVITKQLIELMDGTLSVSSEENTGSTFSVVLKVVNSENKEMTNQSKTPEQETSHDKIFNIVYIEDNPINVKVIQQALKKYPQINLLIAEEPETGIKLVKESRPNLILLDINLPGMNGYDVIRILKSDEETSDTPVIAVSANAMPSDIEKAEQTGFNDYLTKPIDLTVFYGLIDKYLD